MNLIELIEEFQDVTGRLDLEDAVITKYINRGCKFLDEQSVIFHKDQRFFGTLKTDNTCIVLANNERSISSVWAYLAVDGFSRVELEYIPLVDMRNLYKKLPVSSGEPIYYTISPIRLINTEAQSLAIPGIWADVGTSDLHLNKMLLIYPPPKSDCCIEVVGKFYTEELTTSNAENWWSVRHPELIIQAAVYRMDNTYRNTQGGRELLDSILSTLQNIYFAELETEYNRASVMEG